MSKLKCLFTNLTKRTFFSIFFFSFEKTVTLRFNVFVPYITINFQMEKMENPILRSISIQKAHEALQNKGTISYNDKVIIFLIADKKRSRVSLQNWHCLLNERLLLFYLFILFN